MTYEKLWKQPQLHDHLQGVLCELQECGPDAERTDLAEMFVTCERHNRFFTTCSCGGCSTESESHSDEQSDTEDDSLMELE